MEETLSVKKNAANSNDNLNQAMNSVISIAAATGNFYLNLFQASLQVVQQFNRELLNELSSLNQSTAEGLQSIADSNNRVFQKAIDSARNTLNDRNQSVVQEVVQQIDYQLLAKLVAKELKKEDN